MTDLRSGRRGPARGAAKRLVIFLHGYGADGADLLGLAEPLAAHLPDTAFLAPDAPERSAANPMGYQWFPIPWIDGSSEAQAAEGLARAVAALNGFLDRVLEEEGVSAGNTALVGFSQGTMMALHVAPRRAGPMAAIVGFSGRLLAPERLATEAVSKPPVLLVHGDADEVVPVAALPEAEAALRGAGFSVAAHVSHGTGHGIAPDGLGLAVGFLRQMFGIEG